MRVNLIDKVVSDERLATALMKSIINDPNDFSTAAWFLGCIIEGVLVAYLRCEGIHFDDSYNIEYLVDKCKEDKSTIVLSDWICDHADDLSLFVGRGRSVDQPVYITLRSLNEASDAVFDFAIRNGFSEKLSSDITDDVLAELESQYGEKLDTVSDAVKNVLYCIHNRTSTVEQTDGLKSFNAYFERFNVKDKADELRRLRALYKTTNTAVILEMLYKDFM